MIPPPDQAGLLAPLLPALPAAAASTQPAVRILPLLSPILRQRVQLLSSVDADGPWLRLLCYDKAKAAALAGVVRGPALEPHPVSGDVEVDWRADAPTRFRRLDPDTLEALVALPALGFAFRLVYCVADPDAAAGWRVGEVSVVDEPDPFAAFGGAPTVADAERQFREGQAKAVPRANGTAANGHGAADDADDDDDDDDYWGRYDATPARTPADKRPSTPPAPFSPLTASPLRPAVSSAEDDYFAQYDHIQPAMDSHDADASPPEAPARPPLGLGPSPPAAQPAPAALLAADIRHPRPESSASSSRSGAVARLEHSAGRQEQSEFGVKQHVSRTVRSLYLLARASGIPRDEFARLVRAELDVLSIMDGDGDGDEND